MPLDSYMRNKSKTPTVGMAISSPTITKSTAAGRMALRNDNFNAYAGDSVGTGGLGVPQTTPTYNYGNATFNQDAIGNTAMNDANTVAYLRGIGANTEADTYTGAMDNQPTDWSGMADTGLKGVQALSGLANAYMGYKNYGLAKDKFGFEKAAANRAIENQASEYNTGIQNAGEVGMSLAGNTMDPNARAARQAQLDTQKISGLAIG